MHPLLQDLTTLTDQELQERISKINMVLRGNGNGSVVQQAIMIRESLAAEQIRRNQALLEKLSKNQKISDVIDIS
jgi:hypothetical protein